MTELTDDELARLLDLASDGIEVDAAARAEARSEMLRISSTPVTLEVDESSEEAAHGESQPHLGSKSWTRRVVGIAAAALLVTAGLGVWVAREIRVEPDQPSSSTLPPPDTTVPATTIAADEVAETERIAQQFLAARASHDGEGLMTLLAPSATFGGSEFARTVDEVRFQSEWERIVDWQFIDPTCDASSAERVVCTYRVLDAFNEAASRDPFPGNSFLLEIDDGRIVAVTHNLTENAEFFVPSEVEFFAWVRNNHPGDLDRMLAGDRLLGGPFRTFVDLSEESIELWGRHVPAYLAAAE